MISKELRGEFLKTLSEIFDTKETLMNYINEVRKNHLKLTDTNEYNLDKVGICFVINKDNWVEKAYSKDYVDNRIYNSGKDFTDEYALIRHELLMDLFIKRLYWDKESNEPFAYQYWYENFDQRSQAIKDAYNLHLSSLKE